MQTEAIEEILADEGEDISVLGDETKFIARVNPNSVVKEGDKITLAIDPSKLHYFDTVSGNAMYPIALVLIASYFKKNLFKFGYVSLFGFFLSLYHIYLQNGGGDGGACALDVPCSLRYVDIFGYKHSSYGWQWIYYHICCNLVL